VAVRQLGWRTWYGLPGHHIPLVVAARPATPGSDLEKNAPPRLDPLARALKLTFQGAHEEITVDLEIGTI
jgi:hypothetical protein